MEGEEGERKKEGKKDKKGAQGLELQRGKIRGGRRREGEGGGGRTERRTEDAILFRAQARQSGGAGEIFVQFLFLI